MGTKKGNSKRLMEWVLVTRETSKFVSETTMVGAERSD
jgi:hypothetical protein